MGLQAPFVGIPIFAGLTEFEIAYLNSMFSLVSGSAGDCLLEEGKQVESLYILLSGKAAIMKAGSQESLPIAYVGRGAILGELALLDNGPASARVEATEPFTAFKIDRLDFKRTLDQNPLLGYKILARIARVISLRLRFTVEKLAQSILHLPKPMQDWDQEGTSLPPQQD